MPAMCGAVQPVNTVEPVSADEPVSRAASDKPLAVIVAGPTCSGKSALALRLAERLGGTIVNADSMQVYRELRVLTARPTAEDEGRVPHALYGVRPAAHAADVAWWRAQAEAAMRDAAGAGRVPILCGGTGLYLAALAGTLAEIPHPGAAAREEARTMLAGIGAPALHARLAAADPDTAATLHPSDGQRLARAWEVWRGTGRGLAAWHARQTTRDLPWRLRVVLLDPPRDALRAAIAARCDTMLAGGALAELDRLLALDLDPALPAMRAHGVPELAAFRRGALSLAQARTRMCLATGQYTKRQATWFRHQDIAAGGGVHKLIARYGSDAQSMDDMLAKTLAYISNHG